MICDRCKRRAVMPGKRFCVTCYHALRADNLALEVALLRADRQQLVERVKALVDSKPVTELELADARIVRCVRCDARKLPDSPHACKRVKEAA